MKKLKMFGLPVLLILIAITLVFINHLGEQLKSPSSEWSRPIQIDKVHENTNIIVKELKDNYKLYIPNDTNVSELTLNKKMDVVEKKELSLQVPKNAPLWTNNQGQLVYVRDESLFLYRQNKESVIRAGIKGMNALSDRIVFWSDKELFELDTKDFAVKSLIKLNDTIDQVAIARNSKSFIISYIPAENSVSANLYYLDSANVYKSTPLLEIVNNERQFYLGSSFVQDGKKIHIVYTLLNLSNGSSTYTNYYAAFDPQKIKQPNFKIIQLQSDVKGFKLPGKRVYLKDVNGPTLWFTTKNEITRRDEGVNIFEAHLIDDNIWKANLRTKTYEVSHIPFYMEDDVLFWKDFDAKTKSDIVLAAGTDPDLINKAGKVTKEDLARSASDSLVSFTGGVLIVLLFAVLWVALPILLLFFLPENLFERHPKRVNIGLMAIFIIIQMIIDQFMLGDAFNYYAPSYLTFSGASILVPLVIAVICGFVTKLAKNKEWGSIQVVSYFMGINILTSMFVLGPYIL